jgi:hypothetical protein
MRGFVGYLLVAFIAYSLEWYWVAGILLLAAIGNLIPDKKQKKKTKSRKKRFVKDTEKADNKKTKLKAAVKLKKTDLPRAISLLREAYVDGEAETLEEFLRLPNYLRLNKQYDEAFQECRNLSHHDPQVEPYEPDSWGWYLDQCKIEALQSKICMDQGKFGDALAQNVLHYYYELKAAERKSQITDKEWLMEAGKAELLFLRNNKDHARNLVLGKVLNKLGLEYKAEEATETICDWVECWPNEPEALLHSLEGILFETDKTKTDSQQP